ncbi:MAG TPA: thioredoxin-disulfide reductase [Candidatus Nitrosocosmicus sp.]|nr:thioredoxin-disulfide reductase [Candidatus Nitrosocosmicus sp.]
MTNTAEEMTVHTDDTVSGNASDTHFDVAIVGSGPAGYTASIYTSRAKLKTIIISGSLPGGQLMTTTEVENFPGFPNGITGPELMMNMQQQSERFGTNIVIDEVTGVDFTSRPFKIFTGSGQYTAESVLISTGASPRKLGLKSEGDFSGKGVSYCATCDGPFFRDQEIIVVGGGDTALEEATFLTKFGKTVKIVHRRNELRASKILQERAFENPKIEFIWNSAVVNIEGTSKVASVTIRDINTGAETTLSAGGLFVAIGHEPNTTIFKDQLDLDERGYVVLNNITRTNIAGVFAAGDVHDHRYRQAITAAGFGCMAALDIEKWLSETRGN